MAMTKKEIIEHFRVLFKASYTKEIIDGKIYFVVSFGNRDDEYHQQLYFKTKPEAKLYCDVILQRL